MKIKLKRKKIKITPLGGLDAIGRNMTVIGYKDEMIIIDAGMMFPEPEMLGISRVIPDLTYIKENKNKILGVFLTHGHEDHIGAVPYLYRFINAPLYGTKLTLGLVEEKLKDSGLDKKIKMRTISTKHKVATGHFEIEFINVCHSIPDGVAISIKTPIGRILFSGDFKIDYTPVDGRGMDLNRFAALGNEGVLSFLSDSTNASDFGHSPSESMVGKTFKDLFQRSRGRIIIATFASNIHRVQQAVNAAKMFHKKVLFLGRSMVAVTSKARELGYLEYPNKLVVNIKQAKKIPRGELVIVTTGSQGEMMSSLNRMAKSDYQGFSIEKGDIVIMSATPIPGNEKYVNRTIDLVCRRKANVVYEADERTHVSGHAFQEELKLLLSLVKPKYFIPIHGEFRHLVNHSKIAKELGISEENIFVLENGQSVDFTANTAQLSEKVPAASILVDGQGFEVKDDEMLKERQILSREGILIIKLNIDIKNKKIRSLPKIISKGFGYLKNNEELMEEINKTIDKECNLCLKENVKDKSYFGYQIENSLKILVYNKTKKRPLIEVVW